MLKAGNGVMVAATRQHVGKTTSCLAIVSKLIDLYGDVGFIKPVGQRHVEMGGLKVDKDVKLFKEYFGLKNCDVADMSPVVIPRGYTRRYLDGEITEVGQIETIQAAFGRIAAKNEFVVAEGTGHCGVGSIVNLDNARVASLLGLDMVLVVNGGLGSAFDELALNRLMCREHNVRIRGVLINKVNPDKTDMIRDYFGRALKQWDIPLLGVVPDAEYLSNPTMLDFEQLFGTKLLCGEENRLRHFNDITLVAMGLHRFLRRLNDQNHSKTLFVTHASRVDLILGFISQSQIHDRIWKEPWCAGLIIADEQRTTVSDSLTEMIRDHPFPILHAPTSTYEVMVALHDYTAKLSAEDNKRTTAAIEHYAPHIDLNVLLGK